MNWLAPGTRTAPLIAALAVAGGIAPLSAAVPAPAAPVLPDHSACADATCCPAGAEVVLGGAFDDVLSGRPRAQCLVGLGGADVLDGLSGDDVLLGGDGDDRLADGSGHDVLYGGDGADVLESGSGDDRAWGGPGDDWIADPSGGNRLGGGDGDDRIQGGAHVDWIWGDRGDDRIEGRSGGDVIFPGPGLDRVDAGPGDDEILVLAACELAEGEVIDGGPGFDRVVSTLPEAQLLAAGLVLESIEAVELRPLPEGLGPGSCFATESGEIVCLCCDQGEVENQCGACGAGYHAVGPRGLPGPTDLPGRPLDVAYDEWVCELDRTCEGIDCGPHGTCSDAAGTPDCICAAGYTGGACDECAAGWEEVVPGLCEIAEGCGETLCHGHGSCLLDLPTGRLACACEPGFDQPDCGPADLALRLAESAVQSQPTLLAAELGPGVACAGDFDWEVIDGGGQLTVDDQDSALAHYTPDPLGPGERTRVDVVRAECASAPELAAELGINVIELEGLPVNGLPRPELEPLDEAMLRYLADRELPGATLAVTKDDELVFLRGYGWFDQLMTETMPTCAPMRVASVTKPFTQAAIVSLYGTPWDGGTFEAETTIADGFFPLVGIDPQSLEPSFVVPGDLYDLDFWPGCTVFDTGVADIGWPFTRISALLSHRGGILSNDRSRQPDVFDPQFGDLAMANLMDLDDAPPGVFDRLRFLGGACFLTYLPVANYSNVGYNLLGRIVVEVSGAPSYWDYLRDSVLAPVGIVGGTDPETTDQIYLGRSLGSDVEPEEPYYFTEFPDAGNVVTPFEEDGEWMAGAATPPPYGGFHLEAFDAHGGLVSKAETLTDFMRAYRIGNGKTRIPGEFSLAGMGVHFGSLLGTHSMFWQLPHSEDFDDMGNPTVREWTFKLPGTADELADLDTVDVELPKGVTVAVLFNKEEPKEDSSEYPDYLPGTHDVTLLMDLLAVAVSEVESWPWRLTDAARDLGCSDPLPPQDECGDGEVDAGEDCDGGPGAFTCADLGEFAGGDLACTAQCQWDTSGCFGVPDNGFCDPETDEPGECPGAVCAEIDGAADPLDPFSAYHGDGDTDGLRFCRDDTDWGRMVCVSGTCKVCGPFQEEDLSTQVGCPCIFDDGPGGCQDPQVPGSQDLVCWGGQAGEQGAGWDDADVDTAPGLCYDVDEGPPPFRCLANCPLLGYGPVNQGPFFCYTGSTQDALGPQGLCLSFACPGWIDELQADECVALGGLCDENGNQSCVAECDIGNPTSCQEAGYPESWTCLEEGAFGGRCVFTP